LPVSTPDRSSYCQDFFSFFIKTVDNGG